MAWNYGPTRRTVRGRWKCRRADFAACTVN